MSPFSFFVSFGFGRDTKQERKQREFRSLFFALSSPKKTIRLQTELMSLMTSSDAGISAFPDGDNIFSWVGTIEGAKGTAYENLKYSLTLSLLRTKSTVQSAGGEIFHPVFPPKRRSVWEYLFGYFERAMVAGV